jgi:hypothetical protein
MRRTPGATAPDPTQIAAVASRVLRVGGPGYRRVRPCRVFIGPGETRGFARVSSQNLAGASALALFLS